jgi:glycosyltransferase involved in cell wall biosynthesis
MKVSIVTPSYNQGRFIRRTLQSVAGQGIAGLEHLVMDGCSSDETVSVLAQFTPAVRWVSEPDRGQTDALNKGILASSGDVIGWLNSDDIYYPGAIARVLQVFDAHPEVDVVYGMADHIDIDDQAFEDYPTEPWDITRLAQVCYLCQPAVFFRRRIVERHGLPDVSLQYCMDYEYWVRLARGGACFHYLEQKLAGSRMYGENKTLGARVAVHAEINDMMRRHFGKVPDRWLFNYAHARTEALIDRAESPRRFVVALLLHSLRAAVRWNHGVSPAMRAVMAQWSRSVFRRAGTRDSKD